METPVKKKKKTSHVRFKISSQSQCRNKPGRRQKQKETRAGGRTTAGVFFLPSSLLFCYLFILRALVLLLLVCLRLPRALRLGRFPHGADTLSHLLLSHTHSHGSRWLREGGGDGRESGGHRGREGVSRTRLLHRDRRTMQPIKWCLLRS